MLVLYGAEGERVVGSAMRVEVIGIKQDRVYFSQNYFLWHELTPQSRAALPGTRPEAAEDPDALHLPPESFAPDWRQNFFVVPPPPGMHREDSE